MVRAVDHRYAVELTIGERLGRSLSKQCPVHERKQPAVALPRPAPMLEQTRRHFDVSLAVSPGLEHPKPAATLSPGGTNTVPVVSPIVSETMKSK